MSQKIWNKTESWQKCDTFSIILILYVDIIRTQEYTTFLAINPHVLPLIQTYYIAGANNSLLVECLHKVFIVGPVWLQAESLVLTIQFLGQQFLKMWYFCWSAMHYEMVGPKSFTQAPDLLKCNYSLYYYATSYEGKCLIFRIYAWLLKLSKLSLPSNCYCHPKHSIRDYWWT